MPSTVHGIKTQAITQSEERGSMDRYGVDMITRVEKIPKDQFPRLIRPKYSVHPRFTTMAVSRVDWEKGKDGQFYQVTYQYEGFLNDLPEPTYTLNVSTNEEPIQIHPKFQSFAGTPKNPKNGAIFIDPKTGKISTDNSKAVFREFSFQESASQSFAGVESFLSPGATWQEISFDTKKPSDLGQLGTIDTPDGRAPRFGSGRDWLYNGAEYTRRGHIYEIRKTWLLSAKGGWNEEIYK
jgi:hypothetical protein